MTEHRHTTRYDADRPGDAADPSAGATAPGRRRFARLVDHPATRRLSRPRLVLAALLVVALVGVALRGGASAVRAARDWLYAHPTQQIRRDQVEFVPPPDPWIKSGATTFQEAVSDREFVSLPSLDLAEVAKALKLCPWVRSVGSIRRDYGRLLVELTYYQPVAMARVGDGWVVIDRDATILPANDIAWEPGERSRTPRGRGEPLLLLGNFAPPDDLKPGSFWGQVGRPDPLVREAARLAEFLAAEAAAEPDAGLRFREILPRPDADPSSPGLFAFLGGETPVFWDALPDRPAGSGRPTAQERWSLLRDWVQAHPKVKVRRPDYLYFDGNRVGVWDGVGNRPRTIAPP